MIRVTLLAAMTMLGTSVFAQHERICTSHEHNLALQQSNPEMISRISSIEKHTREFAKFQNENRSNEELITIPVVVHVIWNTEKQNISNAQIRSQIEVLNEDFRKLNENFSATVDGFKDIAADFNVEFCLASVDPSGNASTGITRKQSTRTNWGTGDDVKKTEKGGVDAWPADHYLNMWVANIGGGVLGFAQFPGGAKSTDGVVMSPQYFGSKEKQNVGENFYLSAPFDLGRTTTHEVGHWLNLRHIWGDGGCGFDDLVEDTPMSDAANYGCPTTHQSCGTLDNVQNFMDYSDDACMTMFTQGQKTRTRALFAEGGFRYEMRSSNGCGSVDTRCSAPDELSVENIAEHSATLSFSGGVIGDSYTVQINENEKGWMTVSTIDQQSYGFQNLESCTFYKVRVISNCDDVSTQDTSILTSFTTFCDEIDPQFCETPTGLDIADQGGNFLVGNVLISWDEVVNAESYQYELRVASLPFLKVIRSVGSDVNSISYNGLPKWWSYEVRIRSKCGEGLGYSDWTPYEFFIPGNNRYATQQGDISERFEYDRSAIFNVYPNPAKQKINLRFGADLQDVQIQLSDMTGKTVKAFSNNMHTNQILTLDVTDLPPGIYFLNLRVHDTELMTEKIMIAQ